jgi:hypothetical protein
VGQLIPRSARRGWRRLGRSRLGRSRFGRPRFGRPRLGRSRFGRPRFGRLRPGRSRPGRSRRAQRGFVLLDVLAALAIAMIGLAVFFGALSSVTRLVARQGERVQQTVTQRSSDAKSQTVTFQGK